MKTPPDTALEPTRPARFRLRLTSARRVTPTKEQEQEYVQRTRSRLEKQIQEFKRLYERSLTPKNSKARSWEDLLATFHQSQRQQNAKSK